MEAKVATYKWWSIVLDVNYKLDFLLIFISRQYDGPIVSQTLALPRLTFFKKHHPIPN